MNTTYVAYLSKTYIICITMHVYVFRSKYHSTIYNIDFERKHGPGQLPSARYKWVYT